MWIQAAKMADDREIFINIVLIDEETNTKEVLTFQCYVTDDISVKEFMDKIPHYSQQKNLCNKSYDCLCLENNLILKDSDSLQSYFPPSKENHFVIAVSTGKTCAQSINLALPIIQRTKCISNSQRNSIRLSSKKRNAIIYLNYYKLFAVIPCIALILLTV